MKCLRNISVGQVGKYCLKEQWNLLCLIKQITPCRFLSVILFQVITSFDSRESQHSSSTRERTNNFYTPSWSANFLVETSFASLQSPSSNSSITNGYFSTRSHFSPCSYRRQTIDSPPSNTACSTSHSVVSEITPVLPTHLMKGFSVKSGSSEKPKFDLIHDNWLGLAPLASSESLSDLSSISSRASLVTKMNVFVEINTTPKVSCEIL